MSLLAFGAGVPMSVVAIGVSVSGFAPWANTST
jgi:hypothetical protein